jgi:Protein of unknown function (DUF1552)
MRATGGFLTGTTITRTTGENLRSNGVSMDQVCAKRIGHFTPLPSLELGIEPPATGVDANVGYTQLYGAHIAWSTPATPLAKEINPKSAFNRVFRTRVEPGDRTATAAREKSVLDLVLDDARKLQAQLGSADREKLNEYLESVRSVEQRIEFDAARQRETVMSDPLARAAIEQYGRRVDAYSDPGRVSERRGDHTEHVRLMLATGRHLVFDKNTPLTNLYRSMMRRMGAPMEAFADSTGELPGLDDPTFYGAATVS